MSSPKSTGYANRCHLEHEREGSGFILMWRLMGQEPGRPKSASTIVLVIALVIAAVTVGMAGPAIAWTTTLVPVSEASGAIAGTAELDSTGPATSTAMISIRGDQPGAIRPWHVHHGQCGQDGAVLGSASEHPPVKVGQNGTGTATATLGVAPPAGGDYLVNLHASAADLQTIVACGDLQRSGE